MRNAHKTLVRKPEGKRPVGKPRHRWENNIRMNLGEIELESVDSIQLSGQGPMAGSCKHSNEPHKM
jgi:hypothetical protein